MDEETAASTVQAAAAIPAVSAGRGPLTSNGEGGEAGRAAAVCQEIGQAGGSGFSGGSAAAERRAARRS